MGIKDAFNSLTWMFRIPGRMTAVERRLTDVLVFQHRLFNTLIEDKRAAPSEDQKTRCINQLTDMYRDFVNASLDREALLGNPLTLDQLNRLKGYWLKVQARLPLSLAEATEFKELADQLQNDRERKGEVDWGAIALVGIAILILSLLVKDK